MLVVIELISTFYRQSRNIVLRVTNIIYCCIEFHSASLATTLRKVSIYLKSQQLRKSSRRAVDIGHLITIFFFVPGNVYANNFFSLDLLKRWSLSIMTLQVILKLVRRQQEEDYFVVWKWNYSKMALEKDFPSFNFFPKENKFLGQQHSLLSLHRVLFLARSGFHIPFHSKTD